MTQKELLYVQDAIEHESSIIEICRNFLSNLNDDDLISFMENEINNHEEIKTRLLNKLEEKANE